MRMPFAERDSQLQNSGLTSPCMRCRQRRSIVSVAEYETDRESLRRMLADFQDDYLAKHRVNTNIAKEQPAGFTPVRGFERKSALHRLDFHMLLYRKMRGAATHPGSP